MRIGPWGGSGRPEAPGFRPRVGLFVADPFSFGEGDVGVEDCLGVCAVRAGLLDVAARIHEERRADAFPAGPWTIAQEADVTAAGNPNLEFAGYGAIAVAPEFAVRIGLIVMFDRDSPGARRENKLCAHQSQGSSDHLPQRKGIGANHDTDFAQGRGSDGEAISLRIEIMGERQLVQFAMQQKQFAGGSEEHG